MSWDAHHTESEQLASEAELLLSRGHRTQAANLYRRAAEAEERAFFALDAGKSRTRGITAISALSLWLKAGECEHVAELGERLLSTEALPRFAREQIGDIMDSLNEANGSGNRRYEVVLTLRYAVDAVNGRVAEQEVMERWRSNEASAAIRSDGELLEVHAKPLSAK
jgi:hypothetical protein